MSEDRGSDVLLVSFHGAVTRKAGPLAPVYGYRSFLLQRSESFLCVCDPTLELDDVVTLGWYIGTEDRDVHSEVAELVQREAQRMGATRLVFVGSSGGGFAAMAVAARVPGSAAVAFSPSLAIDRVSPAHTANFMAAAFPQRRSYDELYQAHPARVSMDAAYRKCPDVQLFLVQNSGDMSRMTHSYMPFAQEHAAHGCCTLAVEHHGDGHVAPPPERFHHWLDVACQ